MGFGHRVYRAEDPRARVLRRTAKELGAPPLRGGRGAGEGRAGGAARPLARTGCSPPTSSSGRPWCSTSPRCRAHMFTSMFTCARVAGWSAHILEQKRLSGWSARPPATSARGPRKPEEVEGYAEMPVAVQAAAIDTAVVSGVGDRGRRGRPVRHTVEARRDQRFDHPDPTSSSPPTAASAAARPRCGRRRVAGAGRGRRRRYLGTSHRQKTVRDQVARLRRGLAELFAPARGVRGGPRQRRHHRLLGRGGVRAGPGPGPVRHASASSAPSSPTWPQDAPFLGEPTVLQGRAGQRAALVRPRPAWTRTRTPHNETSTGVAVPVRRVGRRRRRRAAAASTPPRAPAGSRST